MRPRRRVWSWLAGLSLVSACGVEYVVVKTDPPAASDGENEAPATPEAPFRAQPPAREPREPYLPPAPHAMTLRNGMKVLVVERHTSRVAGANLVSRFSKASFPNERPGLFDMMAQLTVSQPGPRSGPQVFDAMNEDLFTFKNGAYADRVTLGVRGFSGSFDTALEVLRDAALRPQFPAEKLDVVRSYFASEAAKRLQTVGQIAKRNFYTSVYGFSHPHAASLRFAPADFEKASRDDILRAWREVFDPTGTTLIVAGDVEPRAIEAKIEALFGDWKPDPRRRKTPPVRPPVTAPPRLVVVDRPGATKATVIYGAALPAVDAANHASYALFRQLLARTILARLQREGAPEGATELAWVRGSTVLTWSGEVRSDHVAAVLTSHQDALRALRDSGAAPGELDGAKRSLLRSVPPTLEHIDGLLSISEDGVVYDLPTDHLATFAARINALTPADVARVVPPPTAFTAVVVGDLAKLEGPLLALGWGAIEQRDELGGTLRDVRSAPR